MTQKRKRKITGESTRMGEKEWHPANVGRTCRDRGCYVSGAKGKKWVHMQVGSRFGDGSMRKIFLVALVFPAK